MSVDDNQRFFHVHLMKTGGTALNMLLRRQFPVDAIFPGPGDRTVPNPSFDIDNLVSVWPDRRSHTRVISGHFPYCAVAMLGDEFATFSILRHPVERTLSLLRKHHMRLDDDDPRTLVDLYDDPMIFKLLIENHMVKMFSIRPDEVAAGAGMTTPVDFDEGHLERAVVAVDRVTVVGIQERFDDMVAALDDTFGWAIGPARSGNESEDRAVPAGLRERIAADNRLDLALYDHVCARLGADTGRP